MLKFKQISNQALHALRGWATLLLCVIGIISSARSDHIVSLSTLILLGSLYCQLLSKRSGPQMAMGILAASWSLFAVVFFVIGQYLLPVNNLLGTTVIYLFFGLPLAYMRAQQKQRFKLRGPLFFSVSIGAIAVALFRLRTERLISFLGFGYDNYGHLSAVRRILLQGGSFVDSAQPNEYVTFIGKTPLGAHSVLALFAQAAGIHNEDLGPCLALLTFASLTFPCFILAAGYFILKRHNRPFWTSLLGISIFGIVCFIGYPSHAWFSGFFASNFAALLIFICIGVGLSSAAMPSRLATQLTLITVLLHVYVLFASLAIVVCIAQLIALGRDDWKSLRLYANKHRWCVSTFLSFILIFGLTSFRGSTAGYGAGHFLTPGGIAPLPVGTTFLIFGMAAFLCRRRANESVEDQSVATMLSGLVLAASAGIAYAFLKTYSEGQPWYVPYYPTKLAIVVLLICVLFLSEYFSESFRLYGVGLRGEAAKIILLVGSLGSLAYAGFERWPFTQGYMGSGPGVVRSIRDGRAEPVEGGLILSWVNASNRVKRPVLVISKTRDSELNSRWVNSLTQRWNDASWETWTNTRDAIVAGDFSRAQQIASSELLIITDDRQIIDALGEFGDGVMYCFFKETGSGGCHPTRTKRGATS